MTLAPDIGHIVLLVVILVMAVHSLIVNILTRKERMETQRRMMAGSLTEYTNNNLAEARFKNGDLTDEETIAIRDAAAKVDRVQV